ncbi:electron transfer flavoprotein subunit beta [Burkholderia paludis]|uniref:Electron transfer flavoprotein subunit beta n=2 Tax=Burkholderiaceae TaxID=119060 RepID=A0A6J5F3C7_9BURK|nr:hypothetical protein LMG30113_07083 [Burkholderia paludis]VWC45022.1 electron transfer flavoprotein subunit beta [Burkholderia paludis]
MTILVVAEHDNIALKRVTLHAMAAAAIISMFTSRAVHLLVVGGGAHIAGDAANIPGVTNVLLSSAGLAGPLSARTSATLLAVAKDYSHIVLPATMDGGKIAAEVAIQLGVDLLDDITAVSGEHEFERQIGSNHTRVTARSSDRVKVITVCPFAFEPVSAMGGSASIANIHVAAGLELVIEAC